MYTLLLLTTCIIKDQQFSKKKRLENEKESAIFNKFIVNTLGNDGKLHFGRGEKSLAYSIVVFQVNRVTKIISS